jgi:hypothetical protein
MSFALGLSLRVPGLGRGNGSYQPPWYLDGVLTGINYVAVYQAIGTAVADEAAARKNLITPGTYDLADVGAATGSWDAVNGFRNKRLNTGIVATTTLGGMIRFANVPASDASYVWGTLEAGKVFSGIPNRTTSTRFTTYYRDEVKSVDAGAVALGTMAINNRFAYKNGAPYSTQFTALASDGTKNIYLGGTNNGSDTITGTDYDMMVAAFWTGNLTDEQVLALHNAMLAIP